MTQTYFPFDSGDGADSMQSNWSKMGNLWRGTGIMVGELNTLETYGDSSGMQVKVKSGKAWVHGHFFESDALVTLAIDAADASNARWDRVVVQLSWTANTIGLAVITGTPAASPSVPGLTQSSSTWEIPVAAVYVPAASIVIRVDDVVDERVYSIDDLISNGRLSLIRNDPTYINDVTAVTPASTNTVTDTVTFATTPGWPDGQGVQIVTNAGGLIAGTMYYVATSDDLTYTFHPTYADAMAVTNTVNLTGNVTNALCPAELYWISHNATIAVSIIGLTASRPYDVFMYAGSGVPVLELLAWGSDTGRSTAIVREAGVYVKNGQSKRIYLGTIRTTSTAGQVVDSKVQRFVWNYYNRILKPLYVRDANSHTYSSTARKWNNGDTNNLLEFVRGVAEGTVWIGLNAQINAGADASIAAAYVYLDGAQLSNSDLRNYNVQPIHAGITLTSIIDKGYHKLQTYELGNHASSTFAVMTLHAFFQG